MTEASVRDDAAPERRHNLVRTEFGIDSMAASVDPAVTGRAGLDRGDFESRLLGGCENCPCYKYADENEWFHMASFFHQITNPVNTIMTSNRLERD